MKQKLINLHNALATIETKGQHTLTMADCMKFIQQMVSEIDKEEVTESKEEK